MIVKNQEKAIATHNNQIKKINDHLFKLGLNLKIDSMISEKLSTHDLYI